MPKTFDILKANKKITVSIDQLKPAALLPPCPALVRAAASVPPGSSSLDASGSRSGTAVSRADAIPSPPVSHAAVRVDVPDVPIPVTTASGRVSAQSLSSRRSSFCLRFSIFLFYFLLTDLLLLVASYVLRCVLCTAAFGAGLILGFF